MELLIQCAPAFLLALHWRGLRAGPVLLGLVAGTAVAAGAALFGWKRVEGIHVGVIGLAINLLVVAVASLLGKRDAGRSGRV